jgi:NAD(P)-dependent dehydrogenase (short-subunit alcohol dehydrogenase family)
MLTTCRQPEAMRGQEVPMTTPWKTAVVTGASRGLGRETALALASRGVAVALVARDARALRAVAAEIEQQGGRALPIPGDVGEPGDVLRIAAVVHDAFGAPDLLVNNAATLGPTPLPLLLDLDPDTLAETLATNVVGPFRLTRALVGPMVLRGSGTVVVLSSDAAVEAYPTWGAYGASKAAQDHVQRTFAAELGATGLRFVTVDPGELDTDMHADAVPEADRSTLGRPADAARALVAALADVQRSPNGARIVLAKEA